jgi:hypothetical protein
MKHGLTQPQHNRIYHERHEPLGAAKPQPILTQSRKGAETQRFMDFQFLLSVHSIPVSVRVLRSLRSPHPDTLASLRLGVFALRGFTRFFFSVHEIIAACVGSGR